MGPRSISFAVFSIASLIGEIQRDTLTCLIGRVPITKKGRWASLPRVKVAVSLTLCPNI